MPLEQLVRMIKQFATTAREPVIVREAAHDRRRPAIPIEVRQIGRINHKHRDDAELQEEVRQEFSGFRKQLEGLCGIDPDC